MLHISNPGPDRLAGIRTSLRQQLHSLPPSHRSRYLEGHMLAKQKERLEKELSQLEHRCHQWRLRLADIEARLEALFDRQGSAAAGIGVPALQAGGDGRAAGRFNAMTIEY